MIKHLHQLSLRYFGPITKPRVSHRQSLEDSAGPSILKSTQALCRPVSGYPHQFQCFVRPMSFKRLPSTCIDPCLSARRYAAPKAATSVSFDTQTLSRRAKSIWHQSVHCSSPRPHAKILVSPSSGMPPSERLPRSVSTLDLAAVGSE